MYQLPKAQILDSSFSSVSTPIFATNYSFSAFFEIYKIDIPSHRFALNFSKIFAKFHLKLQNFGDLSRFSQILRIAGSNRMFFDENFAESRRNCRNLFKSNQTLLKSCNSWNFHGAKGSQAAIWKWPPLPSDSARPINERMRPIFATELFTNIFRELRLPPWRRSSVRASRLHEARYEIKTDLWSKFWEEPPQQYRSWLCNQIITGKSWCYPFEPLHLQNFSNCSS